MSDLVEVKEIETGKYYIKIKTFSIGDIEFTGSKAEAAKYLEKVLNENLDRLFPEERIRIDFTIQSLKVGATPIPISEKEGVEKDFDMELDHIALIENPDLSGQRILAKVVVASTAIPYLAPKFIMATYTDPEGYSDEEKIEISAEEDINLKLIGISEELRRRRIKRYLENLIDGRNIEFEISGYRTVYKLRVRHPVISLTDGDKKVYDERGFEYKAYDIYIASEKNLSLEPSTTLMVKGVVLPDPKTQKVTLLCYDVEETMEVTNFNRDKLDELKLLFTNMKIDERIQWILDNFMRYSHIINRDNVILANLLCYTTPLYVQMNGEIERGWGNIMVIGDTTTAKSKTSQSLIRLLGMGTYITAETASLVGLTGSATQVENGGWFVDWGFLPLCDRKLLVIDGFQKLPSSTSAALAESERQGIVRITKAAKNVAFARTRQIKIANPVDQQTGRFSTRTMSSFLYPAQALSTVLDRISIARLDLAVFTSAEEVSPEDVNRVFSEEPDPRIEYLSEIVKWCWSNQAKIIFENEAYKYLLEQATELYKKFHVDDVPLVTIDMKWKLARLSTALAYLTLSTNDDYTKVYVKKEHVQYIVDFIENEYEKAGLHILAEVNKQEAIDMEEIRTIFSQINYKTGLTTETIAKIIEFIVLKDRVTRDQIMQKFDLSERNQLRPLLSILSNENLIRTGRGIYSTSKLICMYKLLKEADMI